MKFLFDPVYTAHPATCSTSYLVWELIDKISKAIPDSFFYVLYPPNRMDKADWDFFNRHNDRVQLLPLDQSVSDRVSESFFLRNELRYYLNPWCAKTWDADFVISSRLPVTKHMRPHFSRPLGKRLVSTRAVFGLDEMPFLAFRDTVPWSDFMTPDTLMSYALSDATLINNQWTKSALKPLLRQYLSPAMQKEVLEKVHEVNPIRLERFNLKTGDLYAGGEFNVAFTRRMTSTMNFQAVAELFRKQFSFPLGKNKQDIKFRVSTNSNTMGVSDYGEIDFIDVQMNDRSKFYEFLKGTHVAVNLTTVEDFSLATYETLKFGVPLIVYDHPWNAFLGKEYPFRAHNEAEAYAMINAMAEDYPKQYARFAEWEGTYWKAFVEGDRNVSTADKLIELAQGFIKKRDEWLNEGGRGEALKEQIQSLKPNGKALNLQAFLRETKAIRDEVKSDESYPLGRVANTLMFKMFAQTLGYKDTNVTGVMVRD